VSAACWVGAHASALRHRSVVAAQTRFDVNERNREPVRGQCTRERTVRVALHDEGACTDGAEQLDECPCRGADLRAAAGAADLELDTRRREPDPFAEGSCEFGVVVLAGVDDERSTVQSLDHRCELHRLRSRPEDDDMAIRWLGGVRSDHVGSVRAMY
jgi:hypothetical protein